VRRVHVKNVSTYITGNKKWCLGCAWWELDFSQETSRDIFDQAAERAIEVLRLLIILFTSVVAFNLVWRSEWGRFNKFRNLIVDMHVV